MSVESNQGDAERHQFTLVIAGNTADVFAALRKVGCIDATADAVRGTGFLNFDRPAVSFRDAVESAISAIESLDGLVVRRVEPDDVVTAAEIADRLGRTRESVRLLAMGARGDGRFPIPISHVRARQRLWRWTDVVAWSGEVNDDQIVRAKYIAVINAALEYRHHISATDDFARALVGELDEVASPPLVGPQSKPTAPPPDTSEAPATTGTYWRRRRTREH